MTYQPQFGLCNQLRALHQAIAIAKVLGRVLIIPDIIDNDGQGPIYRRDTLFNNEVLIDALRRSSIPSLSMASYTKLQLPPPTFLLDLKLSSFKQLIPSNLYYDNLGWSRLPVIPAESLEKYTGTMKGYDEKAWRSWATNDQERVLGAPLLAMTTTYGAWQGAKDFAFKVWHSEIESYVYQESEWISRLLETIIQGNEALQNGFMCAHVRRGNFKKACHMYDEEYESGNPRSWVKQFYEKHLSCYVNDKVFSDQVGAVMETLGKRAMPILLVTNDHRFAERVQTENPNMKILTLSQAIDLQSLFQPAIPVIEMSLCSRANILLANQYSTFSRGIFKKALWQHAWMIKNSFAWSKGQVGR